jgi:SAM-dependent methyltransferase
MQFESEKDPFIDWKSWWNKHADPAQTYVLPKEGRILLNVGSGRGSCDSPAVKGFNEVRMDIDRSVLPNTVGTITDMSTIETGKIDALWASHIVEHLPFHDLPKAFTEIHRVLKEDGVALITVPDVQAISHLLMRGDILESVYDSDVGPILALDMLYGHRGLVERTEFMQHKTGFTKKSFEQIVAHFGFQTVAIAPTNYELRVVLSKSQLPNEQIQFIMDNFR